MIIFNFGFSKYLFCAILMKNSKELIEFNTLNLEKQLGSVLRTIFGPPT